MKYDVTFTEQAENDLRGIFEYIAFDLFSPENAAGQFDRIEEKILSLGEYPEKFRQYEREPWKSRNTRVVPVDNYVIFYIPDKTKKLVTVFGTISAVICTYMMSLKFQRFLYARKVTILSETDLLTGLFNRNSYERKLKVYSSMCNQVFACIYVDVNGLHEINNTKGHVAGDRMLQFVGKTLQKEFGDKNSFRIGGDEFVVLVIDEKEKVIQAKIDRVQALVEEESYHVSVGYSVGNISETDISLLISAAEKHMYEAKQLFYKQRGVDRRARK